MDDDKKKSNRMGVEEVSGGSSGAAATVSPGANATAAAASVSTSSTPPTTTTTPTITPTVALCASCDRCRSRKTKCDGERPCGNCATKYMRKHRLDSIEGIPLSEFECVYSPAKRRGPVPGRQATRKRSENSLNSAKSGSSSPAAAAQQPLANMANAGWSNHYGSGSNNKNHVAAAAAAAVQQRQQQQQQQQQQQLGAAPGAGVRGAPHNASSLNMLDAPLGGTIEHNLNHQLQQQQQRHLQHQHQQQALNHQFHQHHHHAMHLQHQQQQQQQQQQHVVPVDGTYDQHQQQQHVQQYHSPHQHAPPQVGAGGVQHQPQGMMVHEDNHHAAGASAGATSIPKTIATHSHLLERGDPEGSRYHAYYKLSVDEMFRLPPTPTDEEYCTAIMMKQQQQGNDNGNNTNNSSSMVTPSMIPGTHLAALSAARFAEICLGALAHNEVGLAMELCNAAVHCLREASSSSLESGGDGGQHAAAAADMVALEVSKAYFLLGVFRAYCGDMDRYFKYRRICLLYVSKLPHDAHASILLAAVSYLDSWAYMMYNGNERQSPDGGGRDGANSPIQQQHQQHGGVLSDLERKFNIRTHSASIATDPKNHFYWIQGAPPVYLNPQAPLHARALDALSCAVRTCCDQANARFAGVAKENSNGTGNGNHQPDPSSSSSPPGAMITGSAMTPTSTAVMAHDEELSSRNLVMSAYALLQQYQALHQGKHRHVGQHMVISAMDAFLENHHNNHEDDGAAGEDGGFSDGQIQSLISVCNTAVENPFLLHHAGPTYHMVTNAAVLLCHVLNGMHAMRNNGNDNIDGNDGMGTTTELGPMEVQIFEEVLDTFVSVRKLLTVHRRKLPVRLRCHSIPRPTCFEAAGPRRNIMEPMVNNAAGTNNDSNGNNGGSLGAAATTMIRPFVDLSEAVLCACRACQEFVLMACSPAVAAERATQAAAAAAELQQEHQQEQQRQQRQVVRDDNNDNGNGSSSSAALPPTAAARQAAGAAAPTAAAAADNGDHDDADDEYLTKKEIGDLGAELELDDDALMNMMNGLMGG